MAMMETEGDVVKKVVPAVSERGKHVADDESREVLPREYSDLLGNTMTPSLTPTIVRRLHRTFLAKQSITRLNIWNL